VLRLLLDANVNPAAAQEVRKHRPECEITTLRDWRGGQYLDEHDDGVILARAHEDGLTLLTRDISTIYPLVVEWDAEEWVHGGVVFVDDRTIAQRDVGGLVQAVIQLWDEEHEIDWQDRTTFLRRPTKGEEIRRPR